MDRDVLRQIAKETIQITNQGYYQKGKRKILLSDDSDNDFRSVTVFDSAALENIMEDDLLEYVPGNKNCAIFLADMDSFRAAMCFAPSLVMNFANAIHPGGGFLNGAKAQEESLCRASTLYASLSSPEASKMYQYNQENLDPLDSDYMLLSPNVCVFRDEENNLLDEPYHTAVFTIPAPNKRGRAALVSQLKIDVVMKDRLRKFFYAAAYSGYRNLVLGAWGCGAFGHDAETVAGYFYDILITENFAELFDTIIFAILHGEKKIAAFRKVFGDKIDEITAHEEHDDASKFFESTFDFPICNHTKEATEQNIGYTQGIMSDGTPFEAELWTNENEHQISVVMPVLAEKDMSAVTVQNQMQCENVIGFHNEVSSCDNSILCIGMVDCGIEDELSIIMQYVDLLENAGIVSFTTDMKNGAVFYLTDVNGSDLVRVDIALIVDGQATATTPLHFRAFPTRPNKKDCKVIKFER